jgi:hypothetical protein
MGIWVKLRSKTSIFPDQKKIPTYQTPINFYFFDVSPYFDMKIRYEFDMKILKSIWYENFEVNLISVSPIKKARLFSKKIKIFWKVEVGAVRAIAVRTYIDSNNKRQLMDFRENLSRWGWRDVLTVWHVELASCCLTAW